jgi:uncharacterized membrane-anchored protein YhcB (DUF1043 family)
MKQNLQKFMIPIIALIIGLSIGLGVSQIQMKKEKKGFQQRMDESNKRLIFMQQKLTELKTEADATGEQQCQGDLEKLEELQNEKKAQDKRLAEGREQVKALEVKLRESDEAFARAKEAFTVRKKESDEAAARTAQKLQETERNNKALDHELKKMKEEKQTVQAALHNTSQELGKCAANNAELCLIAEELVKKYQGKGLGAVLAGKEPLTQIKRVELEKLAQQYREEIEQLKIRKK